MPVPILTTMSTILCPHGGSVALTTANTMVDIDGGKALLLTDQHSVSGCPFQVPIGTGTKPQPCVIVRWLGSASTQAKVNGTPVLLQTSTGLCFSAEQIPQGPPVVAAVQPRATAV
jgi:hypothetical protein